MVIIGFHQHWLAIALCYHQHECTDDNVEYDDVDELGHDHWHRHKLYVYIYTMTQ